MENLNFEPTRDWLVVPKPDKKVTDADKKEDLRIMINNLDIIIKQVEKGIKL